MFEEHQKVPKGPRYPKGSLMSKVFQNITKGLSYPKGTQGSKVSKWNLKATCIQRVPKGPRYLKAT